MINQKYSFGDFLDQSFVDAPVEEFNNTTIKGSCFYQQYFIDSEIFPIGMTGVTFEDCNLDNVLIPAGNTIIGGCNNKVRIQNDGDDWVVDSNLNPIEPVNMKRRLAKGESIDPVSIPAQFIVNKVIEKSEFDAEFAGGNPSTSSWFKTTPTILSTETRKKVVTMPQTTFDAMKASGNYGKLKPAPADVTSKHRVAAADVVVEGDVDYHTVEGEGYLFKAKDGGMY